MRLIRMCAIVSVLALHPIGNALAGSDETPVVPSESGEQEHDQAEDEERGCD